MYPKKYLYISLLIFLLSFGVLLSLRSKAEESSSHNANFHLPTVGMSPPELAINPDQLTPEEKERLIQNALAESWRYLPDLETNRPTLTKSVNANGQIAYIGPDGHLYLMNPDGNARRKIVDSLSNIAYPAWSHDSQYLAFTADGQGGRCLYKLNVNTQTTTELLCNFAVVALPE